MTEPLDEEIKNKYTIFSPIKGVIRMVVGSVVTSVALTASLVKGVGESLYNGGLFAVGALATSAIGAIQAMNFIKKQAMYYLGVSKNNKDNKDKDIIKSTLKDLHKYTKEKGNKSISSFEDAFSKGNLASLRKLGTRLMMAMSPEEREMANKKSLSSKGSKKLQGRSH
jgi:hypothetical protein